MPARTDDILKGFRVNWVNLRDNDSGKILWQGNMDITLGTNLKRIHQTFGTYQVSLSILLPSNLLRI